jgi:hypothetical protein
MTNDNRSKGKTGDRGLQQGTSNRPGDAELGDESRNRPDRGDEEMKASTPRQRGHDDEGKRDEPGQRGREGDQGGSQERGQSSKKR